MTEKNWAGNIDYSTTDVVRPESIEQLQEIVTGSSGLRPVGSRHSFNTLADTEGTLVEMSALPRRFELDEAASTVTVSGGVRYGELGEWLDAQGRALPNMASLPHISVAGAIATGTHGSGDRNGSLAWNVAGLEFIDGSGDLVRIKKGDPDFDGHVVALGALGLVTAVTLNTEPTFDVSQTIYVDLGWDDLFDDFDAITSAGYSVSVFTRWVGDTVGQVWVKSRADGPTPVALPGTARAEQTMHMLPGSSPENVTPQLGVPGPWFERLPHFQLRFLPSSGAEIQSEYLVPRANAVAAIRELRKHGALFDPILQVTELRTIAQDDLWLSSVYGTDAVGIHFTWKLDDAGVRAALPVIERTLAPFHARPHWGKLFLEEDGSVPSLYPRMAEFRALAERRDPRRIFRNEFLERYVFGGNS